MDPIMTLAGGDQWTAGPIATVVTAVIAGAVALITGAITGVFAFVRFLDDRGDRRRQEGWSQLQWAIDTALQGGSRRRWVGLNAARLLIELPWVNDSDKMRALALARAVLGK